MFEREDKVRYRVYSIEENIVICRIFESNADQSKGNFSIVSESIPVMNGKPLNSIPFIPITAEDLTIEPSNPPLLDLANINLNHWGISCEYRNILHYLGSPVLTRYFVECHGTSPLGLARKTRRALGVPNVFADRRFAHRWRNK